MSMTDGPAPVPEVPRYPDGKPMVDTAGRPASPKSRLAAALLAWFLGVFGIHRLMMGHSNWWLQLITFGGCGFWALIDLIRILVGSLKMADGRDLT